MTVDHKELKGRVAIVTGASRHLGRGFAQMLATHGADVVVHYNAAKSRPDAEETARLVQQAGVEAEIVQADLSTLDGKGARTIAERCLARFGRLDVLINNAGIIIKKPFQELTDQDFERAFAINCRAPFELMRIAATQMKDGGGSSMS